MFLFATLLGFLTLLSCVMALPYENYPGSIKMLTSTEGAWYHDDEHPVHKLFKRGPPGDGTSYPEVGSPEWSAGYPQGYPDSTKLPLDWLAAYNAAVSAGKIPDVPQTTNSGTNPVYPNGINPSDPSVCSAFVHVCRHPADIWATPDGVFGSGFDDGPSYGSAKLNDFLRQENITATHFMIGVNILGNPTTFSQTLALDQDIAVHTWNHPYMTTLSNLDIVAQLGWTVQIIHNSTGGRLPKFWRPPYGDSDNRVRAIAEEVFGLRTIIWNQDSSDWKIASNGATLDGIQTSMTSWLTGPKSPGLIVLEHELSDDTVQAFINAYPLIHQNGWQAISVVRAVGNGSGYRNSDGPESPVTAMPLLFGSSFTTNTSTSTSTSSSSKASSTPTSSSQSQKTNLNSTQKTSDAGPLVVLGERYTMSSLFLALIAGAGLMI